jgi:hypothetical protein
MTEYCVACYSAKVYCRGCKGCHCKCSWSGHGCRTAFRKHLNDTSTEHHHKERRFMQRTRPYGDYLYHQDREKFEMEFKEWNTRKGKR